MFFLAKDLIQVVAVHLQFIVLVKVLVQLPGGHCQDLRPYKGGGALQGHIEPPGLVYHRLVL